MQEKIKKIVKTNYNTELHPTYGEVNTLPSKTIPDQTLSIPELIRRYASGQSLQGGRTPIYEENDMLNGRPFASFDLSEQHDIIRNAKQEYTETIDRLRNVNKTQPATTNVNTEERSIDI